jgi:hypothetical protein
MQTDLSIIIHERRKLISEITVSPLGFLMIKLDNLDGTYTTYNCGKHNESDNLFTDILIHTQNETSFFNRH